MDPATARKPAADELVRALGLATEEAHANREDRVEAAVCEVEILERGNQELRPAGLDVRRVAPWPPASRAVAVTSDLQCRARSRYRSARAPS